MILKVNKDICEIKQNEVWNVGDYNVHTVQVELSEEFDGLVNKVRYFVEDNSYDMLITDNVAQVPYEATVMEGTIKIGVYGYDADTDILVQSTSPVNKYISSGTYTGEADNTEPLTPTDKQQMESAIQQNTDDIIVLQNNKQEVLISGENIKTINNESILGSGNIEIGGGTSNYNALTNKPKINNVELNGNKSLNDLGIQPVGNYALESEIPTKTSDLTNDSGFITGYTETDPTVPSYVKNITQANITSWNNKSDFSGNYNDLSNKPTIPIVPSNVSSFTNDAGYTTNIGTITSVKMNGNTISSSGEANLGTVITEHQDISGKQDITDNNLTTTNKTITSAINEVDSIAKGANQALSYVNYSAMVTAFNSLANNVYNTGQNVMIVTLQVPDLWISGIESTSQTYTYTTDEAFTTELSTNGYVQVGYYKLSALETQKVDLTDYVTNTDYATAEKGGTIRTSNASGLGISNGNLYAVTKAYNTYNSASGNMFIGKGTLENVITGKGLVSNTDYATYSNGGVIKVDGAFSTFITDGKLKCTLKTYGDYQNLSSYAFIGKGTLENVVAGKELDLKQLSTFDSTKTQVLKNINGTLTWVDE